ncbi:hypothetical protein A1O1_01017 [Capronia coronata CBS 617.96]|uniref:PHD-type domain-containing protein n=1 Tax=Capronia coronata CBS 617.96 TaxID=1182541 RepID=W9YSP2_9EURO|nr:uncharacterized protein A1O1_01017 [Capronia coronata CBS 617.96]EXJ95892.1 hypothetical protein A1O1_01017 [Capronia coronata CBS 617.96]
MDATDPSLNYFAPELFHDQDDATMSQDPLTHLSQDIDMTMGEEAALFNTDVIDPSIAMDNGHHVKQEDYDSVYPSLDNDMPIGDTLNQDTATDVHGADDYASTQGSPEASRRHSKGPGRSRKVDPDEPPKSHVHSSKNEGQHTDRRFLCYICHKLFTRRRSVRDHISKIHNTKTWEPVRSLEVIVDPITGDPIEPLEDIIARGPPPPPPKMTKAEKAAKREADEDAEQDEEQAVVNHDETSMQQDITTIPAPLPTEPAPSPAAMSLKRESSVAGSRASSAEPFATPQPVAGRKRPAPEDSSKSTSTAAKKKGTAKVKSSVAPHRKSKLSESEQHPSAARSPFRSPSAAPGSTHLKPAPSKLKHHTSAASVRSSPTPAASSRAGSLEIDSVSSSVADTPTSSNDDGEVFCICRKGDNHTWMIACDGGCDEWFHGNCVNIRERDGELIDKYICPTCTKPGLQTTWKRMCRRKDCRKPARVTRDPPSKYCSDECGRMFFVELLQRSDPRAQASKDGLSIVEPEKVKKVRKTKKKKLDMRGKPPKPVSHLLNGDQGDRMSIDSRLATPAYSDNEGTEYETDSSVDDHDLPNRGGALRVGEIRALLDQCKTVEQFRALGRKPDTPPLDPDVADANAVEPVYDDLETAKVASLEEEKRQLNERTTMLSARETFLGLLKARSTAITEEVRKANPKMKDICGFDPRISWTDGEFLSWYNGMGGKEILDAGSAAKIGPPDEIDDDHDRDHKPNGVNAAHAASDPAVEEADDTDSMSKKGGVCIKNRCSRHRNWAKGQLAELRFEQDLVRRALSKCEAQENRIKERAVVRGWETRGGVAAT